jgi:hypothetical protein
LEQTRRSLDVREEEGDRSCRQLAHKPMMRSSGGEV